MKGKIHFFSLGMAFLFGGWMYCNAGGGGNRQQALQAKADAYLVKSDSIRGYFSITDQGIATFASPADKAAGIAEFALAWDEVPAFRRLVYASTAEEALAHYLAKADSLRWDSIFANKFPEEAQALPSGRTAEKPLNGIRIALDPGHLGGSMDFAWKTERKFVRMKTDPERGLPEPIAFNEGNLALATAIVLEEMFENAGAEVLLTREIEGKSALGLDLDEWLLTERDKYENRTGLREKNRDSEAYLIRCAGSNYVREESLTGEDSLWWCSDKPTLRNIYSIPFLQQDFRERARKVNGFRPHLSLIIHYNIHETNEVDRQGNLRPTDLNYCMAFIPGSFMEGELGSPEDRLAFLIKLLTDDLERSQSLSASIVAEHEKQLSVPVMEWDSTLRYLDRASLRTTARGVFARNLSLTRLIHGTMCFGESLLQDNIEECKLLNQKDFVADGMTTPAPSRVKEVAQVYFDGVLRWASKN